MNIRKVTFPPSVGEVVSIPSEVKRVQLQRVGGGQYGAGTLKCAVIGFDELVDHVILKADDESELEAGAQVAGVDLAQDDIWYLLPVSAYGGEE